VRWSESLRRRPERWSRHQGQEKLLRRPFIKAFGRTRNSPERASHAGWLKRKSGSNLGLGKREFRGGPVIKKSVVVREDMSRLENATDLLSLWLVREDGHAISLLDLGGPLLNCPADLPDFSFHLQSSRAGTSGEGPAKLGMHSENFPDQSLDVSVKSIRNATVQELEGELVVVRIPRLFVFVLRELFESGERSLFLGWSVAGDLREVLIHVRDQFLNHEIRQTEKSVSLIGEVPEGLRSALSHFPKGSTSTASTDIANAPKPVGASWKGSDRIRRVRFPKRRQE
jgi:hypothetical protein